MKNLVDFASEYIGTLERKDGENPKILEMYKAVGHPEIKNDETAWCAAFVGFCLKSCGYKHLNVLTARSYLDYGGVVDTNDIKPGDLIIVKRGTSSWQGHVEIVVKRRGKFVDVIGGNVKDQVSRYTRVLDDKVLGIRRPVVSQFTSVVKDVPEQKVVIEKQKPSAKPTSIALIIAAIFASIAAYFGVLK